MHWTAVSWIVIAIVAIFVMARGCGGLMGGLRGGCGMPPQHREPHRENQGKANESKTGKAA